MAALTTDGANVMDGTKMTGKELHTSRTESPGPAKMVGTKKKYRSRSASASSLDSASSGSYTGTHSIIVMFVVALDWFGAIAGTPRVSVNSLLHVHIYL